ncbi:MAG TPA: hypothetical protein PLF21_01470 [Exilispira sp.]|nr:hypothetical protein [Exilispira sp.]
MEYKKISIIFFILSVLVIGIFFISNNMVLAQDSDEDSIFDEGNFDQTVQQASKNVSTLQVLFGGTLQFSSTFNFPSTFDQYTNFWTLSGIGFLSIIYEPYAKFYLSESFSQTLAAFSDPLINLSSSGLSLSDFNDSFNLMELFFDLSIKNILFIRIGKQVIHWGAANLWTPADFINLAKYNPLESIDTREGKNGVRFHLPIKKFNLFVFFDFYNTAPMNVNQATNFIDATSVGIRADYTIGDFELALSTYLTKDEYAKFGFDFSGYLLGFGIWGEAAFSMKGYTEKVVGYTNAGFYNIPITSYTDNPVFLATVGLSKVFGDKKDYSFELDFFYNSDGYALDGTDESKIIYQLAIANALLGKGSLLYIGKYYIYSRLTKSNFINNYISLSISFLMNLTDFTYRLSLNNSFSFPGILPFSYSLTYIGGEEGREFTFSGTDKFIFTISTSISF